MKNRHSKFEFVNRMDAQRQVLRYINTLTGIEEELFGLTRLSIERWKAANSFGNSDSIGNLLLELSNKLSFLASESQQQITKEYSAISEEFFMIFDQLKNCFVRRSY